MVPSTGFKIYPVSSLRNPSTCRKVVAFAVAERNSKSKKSEPKQKSAGGSLGFDIFIDADVFDRTLQPPA